MENGITKIGEHENVPIYYSPSEEENTLIHCRGPQGEKKTREELVYWNHVTGEMNHADGTPFVPDTRPIVSKFFIVGVPEIEKSKLLIETYKRSEQYKMRTK